MRNIKVLAIVTLTLACSNGKNSGGQKDTVPNASADANGKINYRVTLKSPMLLQYGGQTCALTVGEFSQTEVNNETKVSLNMTEKQQQFETGKDSVEINVIATPGSTVHISIDNRSIKKQTDSAVQTAKNCPESRAEFKVENTAEILITELKEPERLTKSPAVKTAPNITNSNAAIVSKDQINVETSTPRIDNNNAAQQPAELKSPGAIQAPTVNENNKDTNTNVITSPGAAISPAVIQSK